MDFRYEVDGEAFGLTVEPDGEGYQVRLNDREPQRVEVLHARPGEITFRSGSRMFTAHLAAHGQNVWVGLGSRTFVLSPPAPARKRGSSQQGAQGGAAGELRAEMPGQIRSVSVAEGQPVEPGQTLMILEAMKMEIRVTAPFAGRVKRLQAVEGQVVERGQALIELES